jgi:multimeric flavodoxin WrbA
MPKVTDSFEVEITALTPIEKSEISAVWESFLDRTGWDKDDLEKASKVFGTLINAKRVYYAAE